MTNCPAAKLVYRLASGSVVYGPPGGPIGTYPIAAAPADAASPTEGCVASYDTQVSLPAPPEAGISTLSVGCVPPLGNASLSIYSLDARMLSEGVQGLSPNMSEGPYTSTTFQSCGVRPPAVVTIDVTRAVGSFDRYPRLVTPDFVRELTLHLEFDTTNQGVPSECFVGAPQVDVGFAATAADVIQIPEALCICDR